MAIKTYSLMNGFVQYSIVFTKKQFKKALKQYGVEDGAVKYATKTSFTVSCNFGSHAESITFINKKYFKHKEECIIYGLMAHEATHVKQILMDVMKEQTPSEQFEAYIIEDVMENFVREYMAAK